MSGILSAFDRNKPKQDPIRASAALTTVYLLEQNRKFELFMRQKVEELETRVAAQQARLSARTEEEEQDLWAESFGETDDPAATPIEQSDEGDANAVTGFEAAEELLAEDDSLPDIVEAFAPVATEEAEPMPDYLALMGGAPVAVMTEEAADDLPEAAPAQEQATWPEQFETFQVELPGTATGADLWPGLDELGQLAAEELATETDQDETGEAATDPTGQQTAPEQAGAEVGTLEPADDNWSGSLRSGEKEEWA